MTPTRKIIAMLGLWLSLHLLSACSAATPTSVPTIDLNPVRTEVASTVMAQVTQILAQTPSVTPVPSPTETLAPTATASLAPSSTPDQAGTPSATPQGTTTSGTPAASTNNRAEWVSQSVADGTVFAPGETFTLVWRLRNAGTSTWTASYRLRFYSGNAFGAANQYLLNQEVAPGATVDITIAMKAPITPGAYRSDWVMADELNSNFNEPVFLEITVASPATATPTSTPTASATP